MPNASPGRRQYGHPGATLARMTTPRLLATAALLMTAAVLTISGCTSGTGTTHAAASRAPASGTPAPTPPPPPARPTPIPTGTYRDQVMTWGRQFAACVRAHGFADFPDPKADGTFPIQGGPYDSLLLYHNGGTAQLTNAYLACDQNQRIPMRAS
jgi:hypothetical protein